MIAGKSPKPIAFAERHRPVILGIDDDRINGKCRARPNDAADGVEQQGLAEPVSLVRVIDGETTKDRGRHGIVRQPLRYARRQFVFFEARRAQAIVAGNLPRQISMCHEYLRDAPPHILRCLPQKVGTESRFPAGERGTVMVRTERLDNPGQLIPQ